MTVTKRDFLMEVIKNSIVVCWAHGFGYPQYLAMERDHFRTEPVSEQSYTIACRLLDKAMFAAIAKEH